METSLSVCPGPGMLESPPSTLIDLGVSQIEAPVSWSPIAITGRQCACFELAGKL